MTMVALEVQVAEVAVSSVCGVLVLFLMNELGSNARWAVVSPRERPWLLVAGLVLFGLVAFEVVVVVRAGLRSWVFWPAMALLGVAAGFGWTAMLRSVRVSIPCRVTP